jgi:hypothetical protein
VVADILVAVTVDVGVRRVVAADCGSGRCCGVGVVVGEFKKTRHPRNVEFDKVLEICFSGIGNSRFSEIRDLRSFRFANMRISGILVRRRRGVTNTRKPGTSKGG